MNNMSLVINFYKVCIILLAVCITSSAFGNCSQSDIDSIQNKLNNSKTISTSFIEKDKSGQIYIKKPGMMRIDYETPEKISIIIKDGVVTYYDYQLDELTKIKQDPKFLTFLTKDNIDFKRDFNTFKCGRNNEIILLELSLLGEENEKINLQMYFSQYLLNKVNIKSNNKSETTLIFMNLQRNVVIDNNKFNFKDKSFFNIE